MSDSEEQRPLQGYTRWPPVCSVDPGANTASKLVDETDNFPLPFLSRELRVSQDEWESYLRCHVQWVSKQKDYKPAPTKHTSMVDIESSPLPGQLTYSRTSMGFPVHPVSKLAILWRMIVTFVDATYSAFLIPIACAFHWNSLNFSWYNAVDAVAGVVFWLDVFMGFGSGFVVVYNLKRLVILDPRLIAQYYVFRGTFFQDLIAALPIIAEVVVLCIPKEGGQTSLHVIVVLRLTRLVRVFKMVEWLLKVSLAGQIHRAVSRVLSAGQMFLISLLYAALVMLNLLTCFWYYVASWEGLSHSWLISVGPNNEDISDKNALRHYVASLHFVTSTVTTVGYGDIAPVSAAEELCAGLIMLIGIILFGFIITGSQELVQYLAPEARTLSLLRHKMEQVEVWASKRRISPYLLAKCNAYFTEVWLHEAELHDSKVFMELPAALQAAVCRELTGKALGESNIFGNLDERCMKQIMARLKPCSVAAGHDLCKEGEHADCFWIIEEGELLVIRHATELELLESPSIVGEGAVLASVVPACQKRPYTLRSVTPCILWRFDDLDAQYLAELYPEFLDQLLDGFQKHLRELMDQHEAMSDEQMWEDVLKGIDTKQSTSVRDGDDKDEDGKEGNDKSANGKEGNDKDANGKEGNDRKGRDNCRTE